MPQPRELLRQIPAVDELLRRPGLAPLWSEIGPAAARRVIAAELDALRRAPSPAAVAALEPRLVEAARRYRQASLRPVINATGVVLHTNLGRAPLGAPAAARLAAVAANYTNLEFDLATGRRGRRDRHLEPLLAALTGAERTLVVNNNAAALVLALNTLVLENAGEVLVSRGELVEIGETFRIADIVTRGGATLVEVGATNRTRLADYRAALSPRTRLILRVHRSNFTQEGFVEQPPLAELAALAREAGIPLLEDLGSGCLFPQPGMEGEPTVAASLRAGVDLVTYSGDKLLGGPQAGLMSGRAALLDRLRANPLYRALRLDRLRLAALEATLDAYGREAWDEIPVLAMLAGEGLEARVRAFATQIPAWLRPEAVPGESVAGGGARPGQRLRGLVIALAPDGVSAGELQARLRRAAPPIIARVGRDRCLLDLRTVFPGQEAELLAALERARRE